MRNVKRFACLFLCLALALSVLLPVAAYAEGETDATKTVTVTYKTSTGIQKGSRERVKVPADATVVPITSLKNVPAGFQVVGTVSIRGTFATATVEPIPAEPENVRYTVNFVCGGETVKSVPGVVSLENHTFTVNDVAKLMPEGYTYVSISTDNNAFVVTVNVELSVKPTTKTLVVKYFTSTDMYLGQENVTVAIDAETVTADALKAVPAGFAITRIGDKAIGGSVKVVVDPVKQPEISTNKCITVYYVNGSELVAIGAVEVPLAQKTVSTTELTDVPEGYKLVTSGTMVIDLSDTVTVEVAPKLATKILIVKYYTSTDMYLGQENVTVAMDAKTVTVDALKKVPAGYAITKIGDKAIGGSVKVVVDPVKQPEISTNKCITVYYVNGSELVAIGAVEVPLAQKTVSTTELTDVPENYNLVTSGTMVIDLSDTVTVEVTPKLATKILIVKYFTSTDMYMGQENVTVAMNAETVTADALKAVPAGYAITKIGDKAIGGSVKVVIDPIKQPETSTDKCITVYYMSGSELIAIGAVKVPLAQKTVSTTELTDIPENYNLVTSGTMVIDLSDTVTVEVTPKPTTKKVTIIFRDADSNKVGEAFKDVAVDATTIPLDEMIAPEGYELVRAGEITRDNHLYVLVNALKAASEKCVRVYYMHGNELVAIGAVKVPTEQMTVSTTELVDVPYGYHLITNGTMVIDQSDCVTVEIAPNVVDPNKDDVPKTGDESQVILLATMATASIAAAAAMISLKKKSEI